MGPIRAVTVYCSSSVDIDNAYMTAGRDLAAGIAGAGWTTVYGGNHVGLMGVVADAARAAGGRVVGITTQLLHDRGLSDAAADDLVIAPSMRERKAMLEGRADALVALPGGLGTYEEIFEVVVGKQLGYHAKPIVIVDVDGYYGPLVAMLDHGVRQGFIKPSGRALVDLVPTAAAAVEHLRHVGMTPPPYPVAIVPAGPPSGVE